MQKQINVLVLLIFCARSLAQEVATTHGPVKGISSTVLGKTLDTYYGIPFAKPPIGDLRFKHPHDIDPWGPEVKDASGLKPSCPQNAMATGIPLYDVPEDYSEDCLYLNAWIPSRSINSPKLAAMVWIYGGGFTTGTTRVPLYDGKYLAAQNDVIVFSLNYRLGALGFLYMGHDTFPGNQGLMDQSLALKWIYNNVEAFGGDRNSITIFGESAGGASVSHHLLSPMSREFFSRAIMQSGASSASWAYDTREGARLNTNLFAEKVDCLRESELEMYNCIQGLSSDRILQVQGQLVQESSITAFEPVIDGNFLPEDPNVMIEKGNFKQAAVLLGVVKNEGSSFLTTVMPSVFSYTNTINVTRSQFDEFLKIYTYRSPERFNPVVSQYINTKVVSQLENYEVVADNIYGDDAFKCPVSKLASHISKLSDTFLYSYESNISVFPLPEWMGTIHAGELEILFGHYLGNMLTPTDSAVQLSLNIMAYWTNFAKTGNPNSPAPVPMEWPKFDMTSERLLVLDNPDKPGMVRQGLRKQECVFWNELVPLMSKHNNMDTTAEKVVVMPCVSAAPGSEVKAIYISMVAIATLAL